MCSCSKAAALGDAPAPLLGVVAVQPDPVGYQVPKEKGEHGLDRFGYVPPTLVVHLGKETDLELGQAPVDRPDIDYEGIDAQRALLHRLASFIC